MEFETLAAGRYSLRKFSDRPIEQEKLDLVLEAARKAPTAHNLQPQHIFVIKSAEGLEKAYRCTACHFGSPVILVLAYNEESSWHRETDGKMHGEIDTAIAAAQMMLQAADLGLGTTYVGVFDPAALAREFPEIASYRTIGLMPIGYPAEGAHPSRLHADRKPLSEMVSYL